LACPAVTTGLAGSAYSSALIAAGGTTPYTFSILAGGTGISPLTLNSSTGVISGTLPNFATTITFKGGVTDSSAPPLNADTGTTLCVITVTQPNIGCVLTPGGYKNHFVNKVIGITLTLAPGTPSYSAAQVLTIISTGGGGVNALGRSLFTALLNIHYGAVAPASVLNILAAAETDYAAGIGNDTFNTILDGFNNGSAGQLECTN
jgi:hypothetical protein